MLGEKIRNARKKKGFTLAELGEKIGIKHASLSQIETGKTNPSKRTLIALAKVLGDNFGETELDQYISDSNTPNSKKEIIEKMSFREFASLKFGGKSTRRTKEEIEMLTKLLDAEIERMAKET